MQKAIPHLLVISRPSLRYCLGLDTMLSRSSRGCLPWGYWCCHLGGAGSMYVHKQPTVACDS